VNSDTVKVLDLLESEISFLLSHRMTLARFGDGVKERTWLWYTHFDAKAVTCFCRVLLLMYYCSVRDQPKVLILFMGMFKLFDRGDTVPVVVLNFLQIPRVDDVVVVVRW
jgi:hypothetical protein